MTLALPSRLLRFAAVAAMTAIAACRAAPARPAPANPLVVVGVDGLEWRIVLEMAAASRLPALSSLMHDGVSARLATLEPALSPPIWTTMATGVLPARHGILGFVHGDRKDEHGRPLAFTNRDRRVKAIWNIASDAGLSSCVVGYWMTFPVEEIDGVMVAQSGAPPGSAQKRTRKSGLRADVDGQVHPAALAPRIFEIAARASPGIGAREQELYGDWSLWPAAMKRLVEHSRWSLEADTAYQDIALDLAGRSADGSGNRPRCDVLIVYLGLPDVLGHRFWRWTAPGDFASPPPPTEVAEFGDVLRRAYVQVDRFIGALRERAGSGATFVVASDHGMGAFRPADPVDLARSDGPLLRTGGHSAARDGLLVAAGPGIGRREAKLPAAFTEVPRSGSVVDMAPTLLALLGLARGADMDGRAMDSLLDAAVAGSHAGREVATHTPPDWQATRRFGGAERATDPASEKRIEQLRGLGYLE